MLALFHDDDVIDADELYQSAMEIPWKIGLPQKQHLQ